MKNTKREISLKRQKRAKGRKSEVISYVIFTTYWNEKMCFFQEMVIKSEPENADMLE